MRTPFDNRIRFHSRKALLFDTFRKHILQSSQSIGSNRRIIPQDPDPAGPWVRVRPRHRGGNRWRIEKVEREVVNPGLNG